MGKKYYLFTSQGLLSIRANREVLSEDKIELKKIREKLGNSDSYMIISVENKRIGSETVTVSADVVSLENGDIVSVPGKFLKPISRHLDPAKPATNVAA